MESESKTLGRILSEISVEGKERNRAITLTAERIALPIEGNNIVARSLEEGTSFIVDRAHQDAEARALAVVLQSDHFVVAPLRAEGKKLGAIVADNFVTEARILEEDRRLLETFVSQAALAILKASLHTDLQRRLREIEEAHQELRDNHLELLRAETQIALGGLASTLIHDLKAPLVSIGLLARAAAADLEEGHGIRPRLEQIAEKALEIEEYLKAASRTPGRRGRRNEPVSIEDLIGDTLGLLKGLLMKSKVKAVVKAEAGQSRVSGDPVELRQVFVNLFQNAVEAMAGGGTLTLTTGVEDGMLKISVRDTGHGIPTEARPRLFSAFFTTRPEGSGMGLFTAKRIVTGHGGRIEVETAEGRGTCFTVFLPVLE
jgi:signal transduction histidine kinase